MIFQLAGLIKDAETTLSWIGENVTEHEIVRMVAFKIPEGWFLKAAFTSLAAAKLVQQHCGRSVGEIHRQEACEAEPESGDADREQSTHLQWVQEVLSELAGVKQPVRMSTAFIEDLGLDSLDLVELVMTLEDKCKTTIPDERYDDFKTVGDVVRFLENGAATRFEFEKQMSADGLSAN